MIPDGFDDTLTNREWIHTAPPVCVLKNRLHKGATANFYRFVKWRKPQSLSDYLCIFSF